MKKHMLWATVVVAITVIAGYVTLTLTGHPAQADYLLTTAVIAASVLAFIGMLTS